jgi:hypothetical protein
MDMKWIKSRNGFLNEAKIKDVIFPRQAKQVKEQWGEKFLEQEEITPTDKIKQGTWKLSEEDKRKVLGVFFDVDMNKLYEIFKNLPDKFCEVLKLSIKPELITGDNEKFKSVLTRFEIKEPSVDEIYLLYENVFRKLAVGETKATEFIQRDERGRPVMGEDGRPIKIMKEAGEPVFTNNLVNINSFITDYNSCYPENPVDGRIFTSGPVYNIRNAAGEDFSEGNYEIDFEIFKKDLFLQILYKPADILNMSISKFYASCQHLYTGGYKERVIANVFDPNSIPAFLKFDTPIFWKDEKIADQLPLSRMQIRNIEGFNTTVENPKIFFDRCYPDRVQEVMEEMVTKYSGNVKNFKTEDGGRYLFTPDIEEGLSLYDPYMDRLGLTKGKYIGQNTKTLYLSSTQDWKDTVISPKANIKEVIVETTNIPENMLEFPFDLNWIKFKFLKINHLDIFKFKTQAYAFDKCRFAEGLVEEIKSANPDLQKLSFISCDIPKLDLSPFTELDELELLYTLDAGDKLEDVMKSTKVKTLRLSGDVLSEKDNKKFIQDLKKSGTKVEIVGLVI